MLWRQAFWLIDNGFDASCGVGQGRCNLLREQGGGIMRIVWVLIDKGGQRNRCRGCIVCWLLISISSSPTYILRFYILYHTIILIYQTPDISIHLSIHHQSKYASTATNHNTHNIYTPKTTFLQRAENDSQSSPRAKTSHRLPPSSPRLPVRFLRHCHARRYLL